MSRQSSQPLDVSKPAPKRGLYWRFNRWLERNLPEGLYSRSLIIVIAPMVLLQSLMIYFVLQQHWSEVTKQLSRSIVRDMAFVISMYESSDRSEKALKNIVTLANKHLLSGLSVQRGEALPPVAEKPYFSLVDIKISKYIANRVYKPFWLDTLSNVGYVDARIQVEKGLIFRFLVPVERVSAPRTMIFLLSMIGFSLILLIVAIMFLRKQISPIVRLADAAKAFGMGRQDKSFYPSGAREVKNAARAFISMRERIGRHVDQRTAMLAGVSHDLRTILTRFKLELAFMGEGEKAVSLRQDVSEMQGMLEGYMSFVKGDGGEKSESRDINEILQAVCDEAKRSGHAVTLNHRAKIVASVKPDSFKRLVANLVNNAVRFGERVVIDARLKDQMLLVLVEDDGPGIAPENHEEVFRPFVRLDGARNQNMSGTGLGLAIAQDIAHNHGGKIVLGKSRLGGLRVCVEIPV